MDGFRWCFAIHRQCRRLLGGSWEVIGRRPSSVNHTKDLFLIVLIIEVKVMGELLDTSDYMRIR